MADVSAYSVCITAHADVNGVVPAGVVRANLDTDVTTYPDHWVALTDELMASGQVLLSEAPGTAP